MGRTVGLVAMVCSLGVAALLMALNMQHSGPASPSTQQAEQEATAGVASMNFTAAATELETYHAENGTYVGASLPASFGVTLMRADAASYCLQAGIGTSVQHFSGPGGPAATGPC